MMWNCNKGLRGKVEDAAILGRDSRADIFTINEPFALSVELSKEEKSRYCSQASKHGYVIHISKHQIVLIKDNFANTQISSIRTTVEGRIMAQQFSPRQNEMLLLISIYGVAEGGEGDLAIIMNKNNTRRSILKELDYIKTSYLARARDNNIDEPMILMQGDLQDTVTRSGRDNMVPANSRKQNPLGVLCKLDQPSSQPKPRVCISSKREPAR